MGTVNDEIAVPKYGLKLKLNHEYPEVRTPGYIPSFRLLWAHIWALLR